jgi:hypothetical protein
MFPHPWDARPGELNALKAGILSRPLPRAPRPKPSLTAASRIMFTTLKDTFNAQGQPSASSLVVQPFPLVP